jgi:hypothetical protein
MALSLFMPRQRQRWAGGHRSAHHLRSHGERMALAGVIPVFADTTRHRNLDPVRFEQPSRATPAR